MVIKSKDLQADDFGAIKVKKLFENPQIENISVAIITVEGINRKSKNTKSDIFYYVIDGQGEFTIDGKEDEIEKGDLVLVTKNTVFTNTGNMTLLVFASPRYSEEDVEYLD